jgi:hypothetical protein
MSMHKIDIARCRYYGLYAVAHFIKICEVSQSEVLCKIDYNL